MANTAGKLRKDVGLEGHSPEEGSMCLIPPSTSQPHGKLKKQQGGELASHHPLVPSMHSANGYAEKTIHLSGPSASSWFGTLWRWDNGYGVMC